MFFFYYFNCCKSKNIKENKKSLNPFLENEEIIQQNLNINEVFHLYLNFELREEEIN